MTATDSRLGPGALTLGTTDFGAQASNVSLVPTNDSTDGTPTLADPTPAPEIKTTWALKGTGIQDWEDAAGFVEFCRLNNNTEQSFEWLPNSSKGVSYTGTCKVVAVEIGGDVAVQNTSDFEFTVVGDVTRTVAGAVPTAPRNLSGTAETANIVILDWDAPSAGAPTSYKVYQASTLGGVYSEVTTNITKTGTTARVSSLTTATTYFFKVAAVNGSGTGAQTAAVDVTTP